MRTRLCWMLLVAFSTTGFTQVDTTFIYKTNMPYGTLDLRIRKSASRYYYLQTGTTFSFRESAPGTKTNKYLNMTSWDSSPYTEGQLREKNGSADYFIMNYRLLFPNNYNASYSPGYPLIIMMHGLGERGNCWDTQCYHATASYNPNVNDPPAPKSANHQLLNNDHNLLHGGKQHLDARNAAGSRLPNDPSLPAKAFPGFVLFPQSLNGWSSASVQDAIRIIRLVIQKYKIDPNRVYIHGLSNGGVATYEAIKRAPWLFAAALPMSAPSDGGINSQQLASSLASVPLWIFQGGIDPAPTPSKTEGYIKKFREAGLSVRYTKYDHLGHGVWNTAYNEPEFFRWMLSQNKATIRPYADVAKTCKTTGKGVLLSLAPGFRAYQWERNGAIIAGATSATYVATTTGTYRARFSRVANPGSSQWNQWSDPIQVTENNPLPAKMDQIGTVLLKGLDRYGNARFTAQGDHLRYHWYHNGVKLPLADNVTAPIIKSGDCSSGPCPNDGAYTLVVSDYDNCPSPPSNARYVIFNDKAPTNLTAPGTFKGSAQSETSIRLTWTDASSGELGFEVWRRKVTGASTFTDWTMPTITGANVTSYIDAGLEPNSMYQYKIRAVGVTGRSNYTPSSSSSFLEVTTSSDNVPPTAPTLLTAKQSGLGAIMLNWNPSTDNSGIKEYEIHQGTTVVKTGSTNPSFEVTGLKINRTLKFTVKAVDLAGNIGPASNSITTNTYVEGLYYEHSTGAWANLDAINWNIAEFKGKVSNFTLAPRTQEDYFNFKFEGYLYITTGGTYQFRTTSSDGSRFEIDGVVMVNNDGVHGTQTVTSANRTIGAGGRRIIVKYFDYDGAHNLTVSYKGPDTGGAWVAIPNHVLRSSPPVSAASLAVEGVLTETDPGENSPLVSVWPNPASSLDFNVAMVDAMEGPVTLSVVDMNGREWFTSAYGHEDLRNGITLPTEKHIPDGLYLLMIKNGNTVNKHRVLIRN